MGICILLVGLFEIELIILILPGYNLVRI
jgi:hypothetical protein